MTRSLTKRLAVSLLNAATLLGVACSGGSSSGGQGHTFDAAADIETTDASTDAPTPDGRDDGRDADTCSGGYAFGIGPLNLTFDQEVAYLCANQGAGTISVGRGTMECDGLIAVVEEHGADGTYLYLFDPTTHDLVEALVGNNGNFYCVVSATGIDLTASPAFSGCWPAAPWPYRGGDFGFQQICIDAGPVLPSEAGPPDAPSDAPSDAPIDASSE